MTDSYYIFKCPECGGLQVDTDPDSLLAVCMHSRGRGKQPRVIERERIQVIPRDEVLSAITYGDLAGPIADALREPLVKVGGVMLQVADWFEQKFPKEES